jgi:hypothetical protein
MSERRACFLMGSPEGRSAAGRHSVKTRMHLPKPSSSWPASMAVMATAGSRRCCSGLAGGWQGPSGEDLASRRAESTKKAETKRSVVALRWLVRAA